MKLSTKWLRANINLENISDQKLAETMSEAGTEIETIDYLAQGTNLCIGEVLECEIHPDSDHLKVCKVLIGYETIQIVCGALNCRKGLKVIVALVGAKLPINGTTTITKGSIRGIESNGMLCSLLELGVEAKYLSEEQKNGIEELPADAPVGNLDPIKYLGLDDVIFNFKILPNRGDMLSLLSIAQEIGGCFSCHPDIKLDKKIKIKEDETSFKVKSLSENCQLFLVREVNNVRVKESPSWLQSILMASGIRPINNIVDIGNYVMLLTGQPIHMYDRDKLTGDEFVVVDNQDGKMIGLDHKDYNYQKGDILITIDGKVGCLGGIIGSLDTCIDQNTKNLVVETAIFDSIQIRKSANRLQLLSDSAQRYIRGIDRNRTYLAAVLVANLLIDEAEANTISKLSTYDITENKSSTIKFTAFMINKLLGTDFTEEEINKTLSFLNFNVEIKEGNFIVIPPSYRLDITIWQDVAEEIIRINGFTRLKETIPPSYSLGGLNEKQHKKRLVCEYLSNNGINEGINYSLISSNRITDFNSFNDCKPLKIAKPITEEHSYLRKSLVPSLLLSLNYNQNRKNDDFALYEVSDVYAEGYRNLRLGIVMTKKYKGLKWKKSQENDYYTLKGLIEGMLNLLGIDETRYSYANVEESQRDYHPGRSAYLMFNKKKIGVLGQIHPLAAKKYDVSEVFIAELDLDELLTLKTSKCRFEEPSIFPAVNRDIALLVDSKVNANEIVKIIKRNGKGMITNVEVFDLYTGSNLESGKKSLAIALSYQDKSRTLTDNDILPVHNNIILALQKEIAATLRK